MRVEVEIGTIEVDALPVSMTAEGLRSAVVTTLKEQILLSDSSWRGVVVPPSRAMPDDATRTSGIANDIASAVSRGIGS